MNIALIGEISKMKKLLGVVTKAWDNAYVTLYGSPEAFQEQSSLRAICADRILVFDNNTNVDIRLRQTASRFKDYLTSEVGYSCTTVVILCKSKAVANIYLESFFDEESLIIAQESALKTLDIKNFTGLSFKELRTLYKDVIVGNISTIQDENGGTTSQDKKSIFPFGKPSSNKPQDNSTVEPKMSNDFRPISSGGFEGENTSSFGGFTETLGDGGLTFDENSDLNSDGFSGFGGFEEATGNDTNIFNSAFETSDFGASVDNVNTPNNDSFGTDDFMANTTDNGTSVSDNDFSPISPNAFGNEPDFLDMGASNFEPTTASAPEFSNIGASNFEPTTASVPEFGFPAADDNVEQKEQGVSDDSFTGSDFGGSAFGDTGLDANDSFGSIDVGGISFEPDSQGVLDTGSSSISFEDASSDNAFAGGTGFTDSSEDVEDNSDDLVFGNADSANNQSDDFDSTLDNIVDDIHNTDLDGNGVPDALDEIDNGSDIGVSDTDTSFNSTDLFDNTDMNTLTGANGVSTPPSDGVFDNSSPSKDNIFEEGNTFEEDNTFDNTDTTVQDGTTSDTAGIDDNPFGIGNAVDFDSSLEQTIEQPIDSRGTFEPDDSFNMGVDFGTQSTMKDASNNLSEQGNAFEQAESSKLDFSTELNSALDDNIFDNADNVSSIFGGFEIQQDDNGMGVEDMGGLFNRSNNGGFGNDGFNNQGQMQGSQMNMNQQSFGMQGQSMNQQTQGVQGQQGFNQGYGTQPVNTQTGYGNNQAGMQQGYNGFNQGNAATGGNFGQTNNSVPSFVPSEPDDVLDSFDSRELTQSFEQSRAAAPQVIVTQTAVPSGMSKYNAILQHKMSQVIVVTGDRRSGKTTTAMNIAAHFASKKVKTLYVDFDTTFHGSLLHFDIANLASYPAMVTSGLIQARSGADIGKYVYRERGVPFDSLVAIWGTNIPDTLLCETQIQLAYQVQSYGCIIIDCPMDKLYTLDEALAMSVIYCCIPSDLGGMLATFMQFSNMEPKEEFNYSTRSNVNNIANDGSCRLSQKGIAYLYPRLQYLIRQIDSRDNFAKNCSYINDLFTMDKDKYNWTRCKVGGYLTDLGKVLQAML